MKQNFKNALKDITDVCKFEAWLRHYFVKEESGVLKIQIEDEILAHIKDTYESLAGLAEEYNNEVISPEKSQTTVVTFLTTQFDGTKYKIGFVPQVLNSKSFTVEMTAFNIWVSAHETQLDEKVFDFIDWMQMFEAWKRTQQGQDTLMRLSSATETPANHTH